MAVSLGATTQVVCCQTCGQYYPENEQHTCGSQATLKCPICGAPYLSGQAHKCAKLQSEIVPVTRVVNSNDPLIGSVIGGRYKILAEVGHGGMGAVYEAVQDSIERRVAIKVLLPAVAQDPEAAKRFINEARAVNRVNHPGLVQISDFGKLDNDVPYIVMEFLKGETLRQRMTRLGGAVPTSDVVELSSQMAESLTAAHSLGIIHRDLKPDNVMLVADPHMPHGERTKLLDFGIAKFTAVGDESSSRTQLSAVMGSPSYMSPEQCRGAGEVDDRSDVYSLGCMIYEMLSGRPPFIGDSMAEVMAKHQFEPLLPLGKRTVGVPPALLALVDRLLIKDRAQRPAMSQVLEGLETLRQQLPQIVQRRSARYPMLGPAPAAVTLRHFSTLGQSVGQGLQRLQQRPRYLVIAVAALLTLALSAPLLLDFRRNPLSRPRVTVIPAARPPVTIPVTPPVSDPVPPAVVAPLNPGNPFEKPTPVPASPPEVNQPGRTSPHEHASSHHRPPSAKRKHRHSHPEE